MQPNGLIKLPELDDVGFRRAVGSCTFMATLVYTPTCGTCQLAKQIMGVLAQSLPELAVFQVNLNHYEQLAAEFEVLSVPCLLIHKDGQYEGSTYRFGAADLYERLQSYM